MDSFVEHKTECINAELNLLSGYKDEKFEDSKLQEKVIKYINCLNDSLSTLDYAKSDYDKYITDWSFIYDERSKLIASFYNDFGTLGLAINLLDADEIIVESTYYTVNNFANGQKARIEFSTDKDFNSVDTQVDWYE